MRLTGKGGEMLATLWFTIEAAEKKILADFSANDAAVFMTRLLQVQKRCETLLEI